MAKQATGKCQHGEFLLGQGCPLCVEVAVKERQKLNPELYNAPSDDSAELKQVSMIVTVNPRTDNEVMTLYSEGCKLKEYAEARVITTAEDLKPAGNDLIIIRSLKKAIEGKRKAYLEPFQEHIKEVNQAFKTLLEPVEIADIVTTEKMLAFERKLALLHQEQERINALRLEAAKKEMELKGELSESVNLVEVAPEIRRVHTEMGTAGQRDNWRWEVIDINLVPREYLMVNSGMLTPVVKASRGRIVINGIRIYNEPIIAVKAG